MAVAINPRAERLLARLPRLNIYSGLELLLLVLIAVQCARLFWSLVTPIGPLGEWKALDAMRPAATAPALTTFDPFFRQVPGVPGAVPPQGEPTVTALDIRLHGVTANQATGGGSAIIGTPDGQQRSIAVGEEIMPGVTLTGVGFDFVTIGRGGATERLYLDQSPGGQSGRQPAIPGNFGQQPIMPPPAPPPPPQRQSAPPQPVTTVPAQPQPQSQPQPQPQPQPSPPNAQSLKVNP